MDEHLRLQQRFVDQELEGHRQQRAFLGRELEPQMFAEEPLGHEVELAFERRAVVGRERERGRKPSHLDVGERGQRIAIEFVDAATGLEQRQVLGVAQVFHDDEAAP